MVDESEEDEDEGTGKKKRKGGPKIEHLPPSDLKIHREKIHVCKGVSYQLRATARDCHGMPVPPGKLIWRTTDAKIVYVNSDSGLIEAKHAGIAMVHVQSPSVGISSAPATIEVIEAKAIRIKDKSPIKVGSNRRFNIAVEVTTDRRSVKDAAVSWKTTDTMIASVGQDGVLVGGEVGNAEIYAFAEGVESDRVAVEVERGSAGKPMGGGTGRPRILLSGIDDCPFGYKTTFLDPTTPPIFQRHGTQDAAANVFWINLQHPLAESLYARGEASVQWRMYHFQRMLDVFTVIELNRKFGASETLDVGEILEEVHEQMSVIFRRAVEQIPDILFQDRIDIDKLGEQGT